MYPALLMRPKRSSSGFPKVHFVTSKQILCFGKSERIPPRCPKESAMTFVKTTASWGFAFPTFLFFRTSSIVCYNVAEAFINPYGITSNWQVPYLVMNKVILFQALSAWIFQCPEIKIKLVSTLLAWISDISATFGKAQRSEIRTWFKVR